jgi:quinol-cytochrome oxidoreductase complex cytochrome b subunit
MADISYDPHGAGAPAKIDEAKRQKLLELVRGRALARPTDLAQDEVMVWPSLVVVEAVCATVFLGILTLLSIFVGAPLTEHANANATPNPSKAPWYFLNLQELLLHMDAGLAGVIVPTTALVAIAAIPYIDRSPLGVGILGTSAKGRKIAGFSALFTIVVTVVYVVADEYLQEPGVDANGEPTSTPRTGWRLGNWLIDFTDKHTGSDVFGSGLIRWMFDISVPEFVGKFIYPSIVLTLTIGILVGLVQTLFRPTRREMIIALFTGFFTIYWVLAIIGTSFRGEAQDLTWPWNLPLTHH